MKHWKKRLFAILTAIMMILCTAIPASANDGGKEYSEALNNDDGKAVLTVYDQDGVDGDKNLSKEYSLKELDNIAEHEASYGYEYMKSAQWAVWATSVCAPLETILSDCGISFNEGDQIIVSAGTDGFSYTLKYEVYQNATNFYPSVTGEDLTNMENGIAVPCVIGICWDGAELVEGENDAGAVRDALLESSFYNGSLRLFLGSKADDFYNAGSSGGREASSTVAGNRSVNGVDSITVMHNAYYDYEISYMSRTEKPYQKFYLKKGATIPVPDTQPDPRENLENGEDYIFDYWYRKGENEEEIKYEPDVVATENVVYYPKWKKKDGSDSGDPGNTDKPDTSAEYEVVITASDHGKILADADKAAEGDPVTLTVSPEEGYEVGDVTVKDSSDKGVDVNTDSNGRYRFTMPADKVTVSVVFEKAEVTPKDQTTPTYHITPAEPTDTTEPSETTPPDQASLSKFTDLDPNAWYNNAVEFVVNNNLFNGTGETTFEPEGTMTRAMFVTVLSRLEGIDAAQNTGSSFLDVDEGQWYTAAVLWASRNGIVQGTGEGLFDPNGNVTREQMAAIMHRYATYRNIDTSNVDVSKFNAFTDNSKVSDWAADAVKWAADKGIINGMGDGTIEPQGTATRAQVAQIVKNYQEIING